MISTVASTNNKIAQQLISVIQSKDGWYTKMKLFLESADMDSIIDELVEIKNNQAFFCPKLKDTMNWMDIPYRDIKVILLTGVGCSSILYHKGVPLSGGDRYSKKLKEHIGTAVEPAQWTEQGVLQLPISITCTVGGCFHTELWKPFIAHLLSKINHDYPQVPWILMGKVANGYRQMIRSPHINRIDIYPRFKLNSSFHNTNNILQQQGHKPIRW